MPGLMIPPVPADHERASMVLPSIKCSSCGEPIPISSMGDHICRPPSRSTKASGSRSKPPPMQIHSPPSFPMSQSRSQPGSSSRHIERERDHHRAPPMPAFGGPSSNPMSPSGSGGLQIPGHGSPMSSSSRLSPHSASSISRSPSPHTPSPTNPFFPAQQMTDQKDPGLSVFGLGFNGVGARPEGPFPNDRPLPAGVSDLLSLTGDSGKPSPAIGMAGVGRRAFQAAAWGVTAGVAMASSARRNHPPPPPSEPPQNHRPVHSQPRSAGPEPTSRAPWQTDNSRNDYQHHQSGYSQTMPHSQRPRGGTEPTPGQHSDFQPSMSKVPPRSASAMDRRGHHTKNPTPFSPPDRSTSAQAHPHERSHNHYHNASISSQTSSGSVGGVAALLKSRNDTRPDRQPPPASNGKAGFFERYKQMQTSGSSDSTTKLGTGRKNSADDRYGHSHSRRPRDIVDSPEESVYDLADAYDEDSALPWATPALEDSPEIQQHGKLPKINTHTDRHEHRSKPNSKLHHQRYPTGDSDNSYQSSESDHFGLTSAESEEVITPSTSFEGLSDRMHGHPTKADKARYYDTPIERPIPVAARKGSDPSYRDKDRDRNGSSRITKSTSNNTITPKPKERSRTLPIPEPSPSTTISSSGRSRNIPKTCQKCGDTVGGSRKFVERDGVVLCEMDWKKMYLPSCRKCHELIETKMVSADDGQLKGKWHASCFTCSRCDKPFEGKDFYVHAGRPWCQYHYAKETGTLCASSTCRKPIEGPCIVVQGTSNPLRFHPGHLRCDHRDKNGSHTCDEAMDEYFDVGGKRYCDRHVGEALKASAGSGGKGGKTLRAEKRRTRMVDLPSGGW